MNLYVVFGCPRSGTTIIAESVCEALNACGQITVVLDELNIARLISFNDQYHCHILARAKLTRSSTINENGDRFEKIARNVDAYKLSFKDLIESFVLNNRHVIIKYPRLFEDSLFRDFVELCCKNNINVIPIMSKRDPNQILRSFQDRNMYHVKYAPFKSCVKRLIAFYDALTWPNTLSIDDAISNTALSKLRTVSQHEINMLLNEFAQFPVVTQYILECSRIIRNIQGKKFW